ncbi:Protein deltex-4 [Fukomys damarensis]|uniref:E3 ubiquitin-protein ligase n=1 Tax=Fukomys damarensis TaxID=885580 RepID=A0A091DBL3_FUKDA|nr:Protein deltex-4 [Fukomys damarensis]
MKSLAELAQCRELECGSGAVPLTASRPLDRQEQRGAFSGQWGKRADWLLTVIAVSSRTLRPVRRNYYDPSSAPGQGVVWEWENDSGSWTPYDTEVGIAIQQAYEAQRPWVDLTPIGFGYVVDFGTMGQINRQTQRQRRVRRRLDLASSTAAGTSAGPPASPPGVSSKTGRVALATLNRNSLQRLALAQSRVLIASGVPTVPVKNLNGSSPVNPALAGITGILMSAAGLPVCLTRPPKLVLHPPPVSKREIKSIPGVSDTSRRTTRKQAKKAELGVLSRGFTCAVTAASVSRINLKRRCFLVILPSGKSQKWHSACSNEYGKTPEEVLKKYLQKVRHPPEEDCTICMERLTAPSGYKGPQPMVKPDVVGKLSRCGHAYHIYCLVAMYNNGNKDGSLQCPTCKTIYGVKTGTQPPGKMEYHLIPHSLPGHPDCKTIRIIYSIPPGIQFQSPSLCHVFPVAVTLFPARLCLEVRLSGADPPVGLPVGHERCEELEDSVSGQRGGKVRVLKDRTGEFHLGSVGGQSTQRGGRSGQDVKSLKTQAECGLGLPGHREALQTAGCVAGIRSLQHRIAGGRMAQGSEGLEQGVVREGLCGASQGPDGGGAGGDTGVSTISVHGGGHHFLPPLTLLRAHSTDPSMQGPEHPNPGKTFSARGFPRHCYLPDSEKGRKVLKLLLVAWDRRLIFAIGTSSTTGESDTVIWNEVHHKTEFGSNLTGHGYPDANYLDNVLAELAAQGISEDSTAQEKD